MAWGQGLESAPLAGPAIQPPSPGWSTQRVVLSLPSLCPIQSLPPALASPCTGRIWPAGGLGGSAVCLGLCLVARLQQPWADAREEAVAIALSVTHTNAPGQSDLQMWKMLTMTLLTSHIDLPRWISTPAWSVSGTIWKSCLMRKIFRSGGKKCCNQKGRLVQGKGQFWHVSIFSQENRNDRYHPEMKIAPLKQKSFT